MIAVSDLAHLAYGYVWDDNTLAWVPGRQALLEAGTVVIGGSLTISNFPATQPVSATQLPVALEGGRLPVVLPAGGGSLTDAELRAAAVPVSLPTSATLPATDADVAVVRVVPQERSSSGALGALDATVDVELTGFASCGGTVDAGTLAGTITFQTSSDGGVTWSTAVVNGPVGTQVATLVLTNPSAKSNFEFFASAQTTHCRLKVTSYTSGTANGRIRASMVTSALAVGSLSAGFVGVTAPFYRTFVGGVDVSGLGRNFEMRNGPVPGTTYGPAVRPIVQAATATRTQVADSATAVQLLASNTSRHGATITNDSSARLYVGYGATEVTTTNYSVSLVQHAHLEVPYGITAEIRGIWASDPGDGAARITEITA